MKILINIPNDTGEYLRRIRRETGVPVAEQVRRALEKGLGFGGSVKGRSVWSGDQEDGSVKLQLPENDYGRPGSSLQLAPVEEPVHRAEPEIEEEPTAGPVKFPDPKKIPVADGEYIQDDDLPGDFAPVRPEPVLDTTVFDDVKPKRGKK